MISRKRKPETVGEIRREADRIEREVARLKASLVPADELTRRVAEIEAFADRRFGELVRNAATALAEAHTEAGRLQILEAIAQQVVAELDARRAELLKLPTLADIEKRKVH